MLLRLRELSRSFSVVRRGDAYCRCARVSNNTLPLGDRACRHAGMGAAVADTTVTVSWCCKQNRASEISGNSLRQRRYVLGRVLSNVPFLGTNMARCRSLATLRFLEYAVPRHTSVLCSEFAQILFWQIVLTGIVCRICSLAAADSSAFPNFCADLAPLPAASSPAGTYRVWRTARVRGAMAASLWVH